MIALLLTGADALSAHWIGGFNLLPDLVAVDQPPLVASSDSSQEETLNSKRRLGENKRRRKEENKEARAEP